MSCLRNARSKKYLNLTGKEFPVNTLILLNLDLHPIAIHLSQALVIAISLLVIITSVFKQFEPELLKHVLDFFVFLFPFTLVIAIITGVIDGLTRFKTLATPILRVKIIFSFIILTLSIVLFFVAPHNDYAWLTMVLSILCLAAGIQLGLWGKKLINVILAGHLSSERREVRIASPKRKKKKLHSCFIGGVVKVKIH